MTSPHSHNQWLELTISFLDWKDYKEVNEIYDEIYPDIEKFPSIHRSTCQYCRGNIIKFDEMRYNKKYMMDTSEQIIEFHNKNCLRIQKLQKINESA